MLAKKSLCKWHHLDEKKLKRLRNIKISNKENQTFYKNLQVIGYRKIRANGDTILKNKLAKAFQRKFRQDLINGKIDKECLLISKNLMKS